MTFQEFNKKFSTEDKCLSYIFKRQRAKCPRCEKIKFYKIKNRKTYSCSCGYQINPLVGTIFYRSSTPLTSWFYAIYLFSNAKNGVSAKELQRQLGVTYKTAWRMGTQIRKLFVQLDFKLKNTVEIDETYITSKAEKGGSGRGSKRQTAVFGMVEREGRIIARTVPLTNHKVLIPIIKQKAKKGSRLITDEYGAYNFINTEDYTHDRINHQYHYVDGDIYTNTLEGFWSQVKRSLRGTYHHVSSSYLQSYLDFFVYHYNLRASSSVFSSMILQASRQVQSVV